jgi:hypothetical protein
MLSLEIRLMVVASVLAIVLGLAGVAVLGSGVARAQEPEPEPRPENGVVEVDPDGPAPQPVLFGDVSTTDDFFDALDAAGFGPLALQEIAVTQPWIPMPGAGLLALEGALVEVYVLSAADVELAIGNLAGENAAFQPPVNATIWRGLEFILVLRDAPSQPDVEDLINSIIGMPALLTIGNPPMFLPPPVPAADDGDSLIPVAIADTAAPEALPATGNGGVAKDGSGSVAAIALALGAVGAVGVSLAAFRLRRRRTERV